MSSVVDRHELVASIDGVELHPTTGDLTLDEGWSPYVQAKLVCTIPADLDSIDPRNSPRVNLRATQSFGAGVPLTVYTAEVGGSVAAMTALYGGSVLAITEAHYAAFNGFGVRASTIRDAELLIRSRAIDWDARTVVLALESDEALLQDYALVDTAPYEPAGTSIRSIVASVLDRIGAYLEPGSADGAIEPDSSTWLPGVSAWSYLSPLVTATALRLYCDEHRRWYLVADDELQPGQLQLVEAQTITADKDTIARDGDWYDAVVITYEWTDDLGARQRQWDIASVDGYSKVLPLTYETPYPGPGAATRVLARASGRGRVQDVRAISDYTAIPGQTVSITVLDDDTQVGIVASVSWSWPRAEMDVKSRGLLEVPDTAWIFDPPGIAWNAIPVGIDWTEDI